MLVCVRHYAPTMICSSEHTCVNCAHKNTESLSIQTLLTVKLRNSIVTMNPFHELVASDLDFMREHKMDEVL